jgi:hypothetical protein
MQEITAAQGSSVNLENIQHIVHDGKSVVSGGDAAVINLVMDAIDGNKTMTFYLTPTAFSDVWEQYRRGRGKDVELVPISHEEADKIKTDFGIEVKGASSVETCPECGADYATYQFIEQGIKEHGREAVKAVFSLENVGVLQVHPRQKISCQHCATALARLPTIMGHSYEYDNFKGGRYACCY